MNFWKTQTSRLCNAASAKVMTLSLLAAFCIAMLQVTGTANAAPADYDATFGLNGRAKLGFDESNIFNASVAETTDGKIVFARDCTQSGMWWSLCVTRLTRDGAVDLAFALQGTKKSFLLGRSKFSSAFLSIQAIVFCSSQSAAMLCYA